ncbi:MAG: hypothetical protein QF847_06545 [Candidatus Marinimicrobia bacterium]|jgi:hypothetical protein|nr:hypothetical protein [Candidatus Neomarinimicrobiota bacterium]MDP6338789.1 hypothetical protein [Candidatus Neomarinimicrobiota bacterium]MDP6726890.1 hypothetical protein [Candidatus Neomarinimicrobiota bacterium]|tara:strand:+ start:483 stop:935 length:453 start_codon:yes stop_codon:yes gene_type:complete
MKKILLIVLLLSLGFSHTTDLPSKVEIEMMTEEEKLLLYEEHRINPYNNMLWTGILPTSGHYRVHKWKRGFGIYLAGMLISQIAYGSMGLNNSDYTMGTESDAYYDDNFEGLNFDKSMKAIICVLIADTYIQTKKHNKNLYKTIFDDIPE